MSLELFKDNCTKDYAKLTRKYYKKPLIYQFLEILIIGISHIIHIIHLDENG